MAGEQGAGGGIESNRRHMSTSTRASAENEPIQETEPQAGKQTQQEEAKTQFQQPSQDSPRGFNPPSNSSTPSTAPMMRASSNSSMVSTPSVPTDSYFAPVPEVRAPAPRVSRPIEPPVTKVTLSELDVCKIMHNPKLRHDINFDPELHFRPNLDGDKGKRKQHKADLFWNTLHDQLTEFVRSPHAFFVAHGQDGDWSLPSLLKAVKDIIQTLVPQKDRVCLDEGLNIDLLMQQFYKGVADLEKLAGWLSTVLKSHCAPMRDEWVDQMYIQFSNGNRMNNVDELVKGMKSLLSVLEAMKLDVANHQIRCLRPILIEGTIPFERRFFEKKIQCNKLDVTQANIWYRNAEERFATSISPVAAHSFGEMSVFFEAISRLILPSVSEKTLPNTFIFDEERFMKLRADMLDAINLEVCMRMYDDLERVGRIPYFINPTSPSDDETSSRPLSLTPDFNFNTPPSRPSSLAFSSGGSATSSPRSSLVLPPQPTTDPSETVAKARNLYNSLVALLHTSPPPRRHESRWEAAAPSLALQIYRFTNTPVDMLPVLEYKLAMNVRDVNSPLFQEVEQHFHDKLLNELQRRVLEFRGLTGVGLFSVATGGRVHGPARAWSEGSDRERDLSDNNAREARDDGGIEDIATRLAHLGILHWRVFAGLVYTADEPDDSMEINQF